MKLNVSNYFIKSLSNFTEKNLFLNTFPLLYRHHIVLNILV